MKTIALLGSVIVLAFSGCASIKSELAKLPPASAASASFELGGKFTSTTVQAVNYFNDGKVIKADSLIFDHANPWITRLHWEGKQVQLAIAPDATVTAPPAPNAPAAPPATPPPANP